MKNKLIKYLKLALFELSNEYKFSVKDRFLGAKLFLNGYKNCTKESYLDSDSNLDHVKVGKFDVFVSKEIFKPGELAYLYNEIFTKHSQNPHSYETDFMNVKKDDVVIDAGACEGFFTYYALKKNVKKVYLFEPLNDLTIGLERTFNREIEEGKVFVITKALSNKSGSSRLDVNKEYICEAQVSEVGTEKIEIITIDEFVKQNKLSKIDFIKMDIEGEEIKAIEGALDSIKTFHPKMSIAVYHQYENAFRIKDLILETCPQYKIKFGGCFMYERPYRPFMLYAHI